MRCYIFSVVFTLGICLSSLAQAAGGVVEAGEGAVEGCLYMQNVSAWSGWGGFLAAKGIKNAKKGALRKADATGGTHLVWDSVVGGDVPKVVGRVYDCTKPSQNSLVAAAVKRVEESELGYFAVKDLRLGMTRRQAYFDFDGGVSSRTDRHDETNPMAHCYEGTARTTCAASGIRYGPAVSTITVTLLDDKVAAITVHFDEGHFPSVVEALTVRYGDPMYDNTSSVQNRMGASFDVRNVRWENAKDERLSARQRGDSIDKSFVYVVNQAAVDVLKQLDAEEARINAGDL